jgi:hypothetical protein
MPLLGCWNNWCCASASNAAHSVSAAALNLFTLGGPDIGVVALLEEDPTPKIAFSFVCHFKNMMCEWQPH